MNCKKCGYSIADGDQFCKNCGEPVTVPSVGQANIGDQVVNNNQNMQFQQPVNSQPNPQIMSGAMPQNPVEPNYQPQWMNGYNNSNPVPTNSPKNGLNNKNIVLAFGCVVCVLTLVLISMLFKNDNKSLNNSTPNNSQSGTLISNKTYKVNFKGFTLDIPDNLIYEENNDILYIGDEDGTWMTMLEVEEGSYSQIKANINSLPLAMQNNGFTSSDATEKAINGMNFITLEISNGGQNAIAAVTRANAMYFFALTVITQDNDFNYDLLKTFVPIINSAQYTGVTNHIESDIKLDINSIAELAK